MAPGAWGRGIDARLREIEDFVLNRRRDLNGLLAGEIPRANAELAKHCTDARNSKAGVSPDDHFAWSGRKAELRAPFLIHVQGRCKIQLSNWNLPRP
jgi:hypothetical protein